MTTARVGVTMLSAGLCLFAAPAAHADFDDLLDTVIGAATAGTDQLADVADIPGSAVDLDMSSVLQDPLAQLDQLFHEPAAAGASADADTSADTGSAAPGDTDSGTSTGEQNDENSGNSLNLPKLSMPSGGNGSGGNGGGSGGNGGGSGGNGSGPASHGAKAKANTSATKAPIGLPGSEGHG